MLFNGHNHTHYSNFRLLDCIIKPKDLIDMAIQLGLSGIAITDHESLSAHMEVNQYAKKIRETHPDFTIALGNEIYLTDTREKGQTYYHFILIAKDAIGHKGLRELSSKAWLSSYYDRGMERVPLLKSELAEIMQRYKGHIIATTACLGGELPKLLTARKEISTFNFPFDDPADMFTKKIDDFMNFCIKVFGKENFFIECAPSKNSDQIIANKLLKEVSEQYHIKMTVATDSHYLSKETRFAHKAYLNSKGGDREVDAFYEFARLMDEQEVKDLLHESFPYDKMVGDARCWIPNPDPDFVDEIIGNTEYIRQQIEWYSLERPQQIPIIDSLCDYAKSAWWGVNNDWADEFESMPTLKKLFTSDNIQERYWVNECYLALREKKLIDNLEYWHRLETEADIIDFIGKRLGSCLFAYFNTFKHYIDLFWDCGSIVGPGRGSATGFLSNYLLGITQLDPIRWHLPYWRFLNKERAELPRLLLILGSCKKRVLTRLEVCAKAC